MKIEKYKLGEAYELLPMLIFEGSFSRSGELELQKNVNNFSAISVEWSRNGNCIEKRTRFIMRDISTGKFLVGDTSYLISYGYGSDTTYIQFGFSEDGMKLLSYNNKGVITRIIGIP